MKKNISAMSGKCASLALVSALGLVAGCLYMGDPGHLQVDASVAASMEGVRVELIRHSTSCDSTESQGLIVEVGPGLEYPAEMVRTLKANCSLIPNPGVEVHVDDSAVVFDFSNVAEPGRFPDGEFEGYILHIVRTADAPVLISALVDLQMSTLDVFEGDVSFDGDRLAVNLAGMTFDSNSLLRVDLYLVSVGGDGVLGGR
jgi:hypothetical protein